MIRRTAINPEDKDKVMDTVPDEKTVLIQDMNRMITRLVARICAECTDECPIGDCDLIDHSKSVRKRADQILGGK